MFFARCGDPWNAFSLSLANDIIPRGLCFTVCIVWKSTPIGILRLPFGLYAVEVIEFSNMFFTLIEGTIKALNETIGGTKHWRAP